MSINITSGPTGSAGKIVEYGPIGVGKTTLASHLPDPVFIDMEGSTTDYDLSRIECTNFKEVEEATNFLLNEPHRFKTAVYDSITAWEKFAEAKILQTEKKDRMADFAYGRGSILIREETDLFVFGLDPLVRKGITVVLIAHSVVKRTQPPEHLDGYDRYQIGLDEKAAGTIKRWAKEVLFLNYKTHVVATDEKKTRGMGGDKRVIYTRNSSSWDAKNRHNLPDGIPFENGVWPEALNALFGAPVAEESGEELFEKFCEIVQGVRPEILKGYLVERGEVKPEDDARAISQEFLQLVIDNANEFKAALAAFEAGVRQPQTPQPAAA